MNRINILLFCVLSIGCSTNAINKPAILLNAENHTNQGLQAYSEVKWKSAKKYFSQALLLYQAMDNQQGILTSHINLAEVSLSVNDYIVAKDHLKQAKFISKQEALLGYQSRITLLYAIISLQKKQIAEAIILLQTLLPKFEDIKLLAIPDDIQTIAIINRTKIAFAQNKNESLWTSRYAEALKLSTNKNANREAQLLRFQSKLQITQGAYKISESNLLQALSTYKNNSSLPGIAATLLELAQLNLIQSHRSAALDYLNRSIAVYHFLGNTEKVNLLTERIITVKKNSQVTP